MAFTRSGVSSSLALAAAATVFGYFLGREYVYRQLREDPAEAVNQASKNMHNPQIMRETVVVEVINRFLNLTMAGRALTTTRRLEVPDRRTLTVNVYSRLAAGARVIPFMPRPTAEDKDDALIVLIINKRKAGKLLPPEGYGKWGPMQHTPNHFADLSPTAVDCAEELVLKETPVQEAYAQAAAQYGATKHSYGTYDTGFPENACRELKEELGVTVSPSDLVMVDSTTPYNTKWGLHIHEVSYFTILPVEVEFSPAPDEVASIHLIHPANISRQADGSGKVAGFTEIIPQNYMRILEQAMVKYEERLLVQNSSGLIRCQAQLAERAQDFGFPCPDFVAFGAEMQSVRIARTALCGEITTRYQAQLPSTSALAFAHAAPMPGPDFAVVPNQ